MRARTPSQPPLPGQPRAPGRAYLSTRPHPGLLGLIACALLAWYLTVLLAAGMPPGPGSMGLGLTGFLIGWAVMMTAMMLPALAPLLSAYLRSIRAEHSSWTRAVRTAALVAGYLLTWTGFGVLVYGASVLGGRLAAGAPAAAPWVGGGLLAAAGIYQLTPLKNYCLRHCRSPIAFLLHVSGYKGPLRDMRVGLYHGLYCVGCCWGLMLVLIAVGVMNLAWMAAIAAAVLLEKTWRHGTTFSRAVGAGLIVFACFVPAYPALLPGLYMAPGMMM
jgi:predicted metal-binding membrane protein